ncbi:hypothetical protein O5585_27305, partial [Escherichia coli]|nr:hypothetical protein [Escherichia coli]
MLYLLNNEKFNREYTEAYTNASLIVREDYGFESHREDANGVALTFELTNSGTLNNVTINQNC